MKKALFDLVTSGRYGESDMSTQSFLFYSKHILFIWYLVSSYFASINCVFYRDPSRMVEI